MACLFLLATKTKGYQSLKLHGSYQWCFSRRQTKSKKHSKKIKFMTRYRRESLMLRKPGDSLLTRV